MNGLRDSSVGCITWYSTHSLCYLPEVQSEQADQAVGLTLFHDAHRDRINAIDARNTKTIAISGVTILKRFRHRPYRPNVVRFHYGRSVSACSFRGRGTLPISFGSQRRNICVLYVGANMGLRKGV